MNIFVFDNTFEGLLTSVFEAYSRRIFPDALSPEGEPLPLFHDEVFTVITEEEKAKRVWRGLQKKLSSGALSCLAQCWLAEEQETPMLLFRYICKAIDAPRSIETNFADPDVLGILTYVEAGGLGTDILRYTPASSVFRKLADGTLLCCGRAREKNDALPPGYRSF